MNLDDADGIDVVAMEDDDDEEEPHDVITYVDQKALLRKQKYTEPKTEGASNVTFEFTNDGKKKKSVVRANDRKRGGKQRQEEEEEEDLSTRRANELGAINEGDSNDGFANEGFQGFRDSSGFGLWGGANESVDGTTTMTTMTTKEGTISTTTPTRKNTIHANSLDGFERRTSPRVYKTTGSPAADNTNNTSAVAVRRSPRKHKGSMDGPSTQTVSSPNNNNTNITKTKKKATTTTTTTKTTTTITTTSARTMARAHANQKKRSAKETNTAVPSKKGKIIKTKTAARGGRAHQSQRTNVRKTALVMTSTQQQQQPSQYNKQIPSSNRGTIPTTTQARQRRSKPKQTTGGAGRKDNVPSRTPIDSGRERPQLPRAMLKMPTSTRDEVLGVVKPASVIEKVRYDSKKNDSVDGTQSSLGNGMEEIEDDIVDSGDDEDDGFDETNVDVVALPENAVTTQTKGNDDVGTPTPTKGGEAQILEEKEKKKVTSFLPKFASPTNDLFLDGGVDGGGKKFKRGTEFTGSGPKARLKRALQKLKNNKLRFVENIKKNRLEYDEGSSRENGVTFHVRSLTMERGVFRCFGHAKPMSRKKTEAEVIGDILEDDDEEENLGEDKDDFAKKRKENKELHDLLDDNGEYDVTVLFTKELQKELNVSIGNRVEIFQPFHEVLARNVFGETTRCIIRADFCRVLEGS